MEKKNELPKVNKLHDLAVKLCEGEVVSFNTHSIIAVDFIADGAPCEYCRMDSRCDTHMADLCAECDRYHRHNHILVLYENSQQ